MLHEKPSAAALVTEIIEDPDTLLIGYLHLVQYALIGHDRIELPVIRQHGYEARIVFIKLVRIAPEKAVYDSLVRRYHCGKRHAVRDP